MNKRIQELAEQCWKERPADQLHFDTEKFAELIVKGCVEVIDAQTTVWRNTGIPAEVALDMAKENVKAYFGIDGEEDIDETCPRCGEPDSGTSCGIPDCGWVTGVEE